MALLVLALGWPAGAAAALRVVATIPDFASLAQELGGERVSAEALILGTQDPHYADAKPSLILKVNRADLLIHAGMGLEDGWLPVLLTQARNGEVQPGARGYLDASAAIVPKEVPVNADRAMGDVHAAGNPHYYTGPRELRAVAALIHERLRLLDPAGGPDYDRRWAAFIARFDAQEQAWRARLAPLAGRRLVEYHASWIYLIDWLGLARVGTLEPKPGIPPSPAHVTRLLQQAGAVAFVIQEPYHPTSLSRLFAQKAGARLLVLPSMVGAQPGVTSIWDKYDRIVALLTEAG